MDLRNSLKLLEKPPQLSFWSTIITTIKCTIGSGLLSLPYSFYLTGYVGASVILIVVAMLCFYSWSLLIRSIEKIEDMNPQDDQLTNLTLSGLLIKLFGEKSAILIFAELSTIILMCGQCISYLIFLNDTLSEMFQIYSQLNFLIPFQTALFIIFLFFSMKTRLEYFQYFTIFATFLAFMIIIYASAYSCYDLSQDPDIQTDAIKIKQIPVVFGVVLYAYDLNGIITEIRSQMQEPQRFLSALGISLIIEAFSYIIFGLLGYLAFGQQTKQIVTKNIRSIISQTIEVVFYDTLIISYGLTLIVSIFLVFIPLFISVNYFVKNFFKTDPNKTWVVYLSRILVIIIIMSLSIIFPEFAALLSILGCVCSVALGFVIPFIIHYKIFATELSKPKLILNITVLVFGIVGGILGLFITIQEYLQ